MNSALPMDVTANTPSEFSRGLNALQNQRHREKENRPSIRMRLSVNPSKKSGLSQPCSKLLKFILQIWLPGYVQLYAKQWGLFHNFFCPSVKLIAKEKFGSKTIKCHDPLKTSCQRIMDFPHIHESVKLSLSNQREDLNPFMLKKIMDKKLKIIFSIITTSE